MDLRRYALALIERIGYELEGGADKKTKRRLLGKQLCSVLVIIWHCKGNSKECTMFQRNASFMN